MRATLQPAAAASSAAPASALAALLAAGLFASASANAAPASDYATVVSSTPVSTSVAVPSQVCRDQEEIVQPRPSGIGSVIGAIAGGVIGNQLGHGFGRAAATGAGVVAGSLIGNQVEANGNPPASATVRRCQTVSSYEQRVVGYDVVYDYAGKRYSTRLPYDPGARLAIDVRPVAAAAPAPLPPQALPQPIYDDGYAPPPAVYAPVRVGTPVPMVYVAPVLGFGYRGRWR